MRKALLVVEAAQAKVKRQDDHALHTQSSSTAKGHDPTTRRERGGPGLEATPLILNHDPGLPTEGLEEPRASSRDPPALGHIARGRSLGWKGSGPWKCPCPQNPQRGRSLGPLEKPRFQSRTLEPLPAPLQGLLMVMDEAAECLPTCAASHLIPTHP